MRHATHLFFSADHGDLVKRTALDCIGQTILDLKTITLARDGAIRDEIGTTLAPLVIRDRGGIGQRRTCRADQAKLT